MSSPSSLRHVALWIVLFAAGAAAGYGVRDRRADDDLRADAVLRGLDRASQAQMALLMLEQKREAQLQPLLERQLEGDIRAAWQALAVGHTRLPAAMPNLSDAIRRGGEYLARKNAPKDVLEQAVWLADHLAAGK